MYDFESLVGELLQSRPELSREELARRIEEKKRTVGAGYLTDQGALFLVAGELGVSLRKDGASSDLTINDLYIGANDVTVVARVLAIYPVATYNKKDGGTGRYKRLVLFDGKDSVRLTVWEEGVDETEKLNLAVDGIVRVSDGYVKQGLDGKPNLNLGKRGRIETVAEEKVVEKLPRLSSVAEKPWSLPQEKQFAALEGVVGSEPKYSEFVRSDGSPGSLFQFGVLSKEGSEVRIVIWSPTGKPDLKRGQKVLITNVKSKRSLNGQAEVHGDAGSVILLQRAGRSELRVAAVGAGGSAKRILGLERGGRVRVVELGKDVDTPGVGKVVGLTPEEELEDRMYCRNPGSVEAIDVDSFPGLEELATKLKDVKAGDSQIMVEVIALSHGSIGDVHLKDGSTVKKGELVVGDDTGETQLVGWRELSAKVSDIQPGERLRVVGVVPKATRMEAWVLQVSNLTVIEKIRGKV
jgi:hypothetical protein